MGGRQTGKITMKYLIFILCLTLVGCGSTGHGKHGKKGDDEFKAPIQHVLDARNDIRAIISHPPRNEGELSDIANMNPNASIFSAQDFAQRLQTIALKGCPHDFKEAFTNYVSAWVDRAAASPNSLILVQTTPASQLGPVQNPDAERTETAWKALKAVCRKYDVTVE